jgi:hypothetical protein
MLAPPANRQRKKSIAVRRAANRKRKHRQLAREKQDLHRIELWLSGSAIAGLITQLVLTKQLTDQQSLDRRKVDTAISCLLEQQGRKWAR